ncbi:unnamed protein product [Peniophora sp. CBMAI 1063]|nr:unnamed protein product [Peniophora sp. CBMAI 1063]
MPQSHAPKRKAVESPQHIRKKPRVDGPATEFRTVSASVVLSLPPVFAARYREGAEEMLDSMVMRYQPALGGVVLAHQNLRFLSSAGRIKSDNPFAVVNVGFDATVWRPEIGMRLTGNVSLSSPDHVSLLVHRTFNVSIPRHHIPTENWEFEYGPAENDPEYGTKPEGEAPVEGQEGEEPADRGQWIHSVTAEPLGGRKGRLEFTVVGLTIANNMLSLVGSLQPDPFSPRHVPQPAALSTAPVAVSDDEDDEPDEAEEKAESGSDDEDDEAAAVAAAARAEAERKEAKRRRKEEKAKEREEEEAKTAKTTKRKKTT